ncbi:MULTISPECIES: AlpA family transcriptional regulator [unclassified Microbacterium]|uniref:helix-turn-helix transcriptional regulator n=1 Tax=unclassified Microbacterium TaxID=2609290 RepID=UPI0016051ED1|nr:MULTISPECIES: helix-turn-helix domain-containing protein [unclassified Microbacterium]QNA93223.1 helix-turn-helix domain-containing protein [Microbacterium sp. Se63.02b]QYM63431.1 helix-turn-helix domain-containing protein [Microbacterium sp. Se5.02b]
MSAAVLDIKQVAEKTGLAVQTLYNLRSTGGDGPKSFTLRGRVRYYEADVDAWIAAAAERSAA